MIAEHVRDAAATAVVFGFFASSWFGWAQEAPPPRWRKPLVAGAVAAVLVLVVGALVTWQHWSEGTAFTAETSRAFGIVVGIEFGLAALGAGILAAVRHRDIIPAWIAFVVGVHLFPVAALINYPLIHVVAALITLVAVAAVPVARHRALPVSAVTGLGTGSVLLTAAASSLVIALLGY
ncbi:hypothetical protein [Micromonospora craniellae]|uniref:Uncharacterized protein n=1 Tax=Micromonospora craniellae TaxID=2294034 RepID=A0A372FU46_9ACTN|nr:hypothetical protein [Micromonospora craniellae]QOC92314.1 hypothetical protein ID554_00455 [Micromonospora craniellae]RFS44134.1 hypothetical protein D0Q02_24055 [Micromonospora craniellae]